MDSQSRSKMNTQIYEEACTWFVESRAGDLDDAGRREFDRWLRKSPEHLSSYLEIAAIWNEGPQLDPDGKWSVDLLIEHAKGASDENVVPISGTEVTRADVLRANVDAADTTSRTQSVPASAAVVRSQQVPTRTSLFTRWRRFAIAASVLGILGGVLAMLKLSPPIYATALGEQRSIQFEDGSTVELNSRSKIRVRYSKAERDVELIEGQALFHVAHDTSRPFIVAVGATRVRAVGTQFDVYKKANGTVVTVVEGKVAVYTQPQVLSGNTGKAPMLPVPEHAAASPSGSASLRKHAIAPASTASSVSGSRASIPEEPAAEANPAALGMSRGSSLLLAAGEQVTVTTEAARKTAAPNIAGATAWREREIVFESATLSDVAEEFNRYNQRQLVIEDPTLYGFHISGVFSSTDPDSLIKFLRQRPGVRVTEANGEIRVERGP